MGWMILVTTGSTGFNRSRIAKEYIVNNNGSSLFSVGNLKIATSEFRI